MKGEPSRWVLAIVGTLVLGVGVVTLFRPPSAVRRVEAAEMSGPVNVGLATVVRSEAALLDKTPLFLPTEWNTAHKEVVLPQSGGAFGDYPPKFAYDETELRSLKSSVITVFSVKDALTLPSPGPALLGFGRSDVTPPGLESRGAFVEVVQANGGQKVFVKGLVGARPPTTAVWGPLEFLATVDAAGLTGPLVLTTRSGVEEVDVYFQKYLTQNLRVGVLLRPSIYRICVGP
jgi:hypothetical protein